MFYFHNFQIEHGRKSNNKLLRLNSAFSTESYIKTKYYLILKVVQVPVLLLLSASTLKELFDNHFVLTSF